MLEECINEFYDTALMSGTTRKMCLIRKTCEIMGRDELTERGYPLRKWNRYYILTLTCQNQT